MQENGVRPSRRERRVLERKRSHGVTQGVLTLGVALAAGQTAQAAAFNVSNLNDNGAGSLRQAIEDANAAGGADVVTFQAGLTGTITLTTGQLAITDSVDVQGPGAAALTVSANNASRVFYLYNGSALLDVTISGLTVTGGSAGIGGGIVDFNENLVLDGVTITGNEASGDGGGLWADGSIMSLTIRDSDISGNTAGNRGGGIYLYDLGGPVLIRSTVISGNDAGEDGGGIFFGAPYTDTTIEGSTISGNTAESRGGGIFIQDTDGGFHTIRGTTISGNSAGHGGGLFLYSLDDPMILENSTISGNQALGGNLTDGHGGGVYLYSLYGDGFLAIRHSTVAGNSATGTGGGLFTQTGPFNVEHTIVGDNTAPANPDLGTAVDGVFDISFSLIENPGTANFNDNGGNVLNQDPQLGALQNNGGTTETHLPADRSPAVNAGDATFAPPPPTDQRGLARVSGGRIDIGAVEVQDQSGTIQLLLSAASVNESAGTITITAIRTGGSDGAVSVSFVTNNGTAMAPADFAAAAGTFNWADGDAAPKTIQVTIINDALDEPNETFNVTISNPQGGAVLGSPTTEVVTILDDDVAALDPTEIPTLGDYGKLLFAALFGLGGLRLLRRKEPGRAEAE